MRLRSVITTGALILAPALAMAAQPMLVSVDGQVIPVQEESHVIQTSDGPARVSTWSWHGPKGNASIEVQTSTGGAPPAWALKQMQAMQSQMWTVQSQMQQLERAALNESFSLPVPLPMMFAVPIWALN